MLVDAIHLYRMLTEMRDINHGPMRFYYTMGYVGPAVVVALSVGVRAHQYGNYYLYVVDIFIRHILNWCTLQLLGFFIRKRGMEFSGADMSYDVRQSLHTPYGSTSRFYHSRSCFRFWKSKVFRQVLIKVWCNGNGCRTLLWVSVIALPLLGVTWVLALLAASEQHPLLLPLLSVAVLVHAAFSLAGYCFANNRVRQNLIR